MEIQKIRAGSHFDISISISRHTQKQYDADNQYLLLGKFPTKGANFQHRTASAYVGLCLCLCQRVNQPQANHDDDGNENVTKQKI